MHIRNSLISLTNAMEVEQKESMTHFIQQHNYRFKDI